MIETNDYVMRDKAGKIICLVNCSTGAPEQVPDTDRFIKDKATGDIKVFIDDLEAKRLAQLAAQSK